MGRKQEVCGAVAGGVMVLGLRHGRGTADGRSVTEALYPMTREFTDAFAVRNGSYLCRDLLSGCDLRSEEGQRHFKEHGLLEKVCKPCVRSAAEILQEMA
jgi:C_GCAxxG_C_C family probable redox protein